MLNIAIFASGNGSNAQAIVDRLVTEPLLKTALIVTNNPKAFVIERAHKSGIACAVISRKQADEEIFISDLLKKNKIDLIVLAGYLQKIPASITREWHKRILNIHPALLPRHGGKGMYGTRVHEAVLHNKELESGITIHYVNEQYDEGEIILQKSLLVEPTWTAEHLQKAVHQLEHQYYPAVIVEIGKKLLEEQGSIHPKS